MGRRGGGPRKRLDLIVKKLKLRVVLQSHFGKYANVILEQL